MGLKDLFLGKRAEEQAAVPSAERKTFSPAPAAGAPALRITYNPQLLEQLKEEHQRLLALFGAIAQSCERQDFAAAATRLKDFQIAFQAHLLSENIRLYTYLEHLLAQTPHRGVMHGFRREMDGIGRTVIAFLSAYEQVHEQPRLRSAFAHDLAGIGAMLVQRIRHEEEALFGLYLPAS